MKGDYEMFLRQLLPDYVPMEVYQLAIDLSRLDPITQAEVISKSRILMHELRAGGARKVAAHDYIQAFHEAVSTGETPLPFPYSNPQEERS